MLLNEISRPKSLLLKDDFRQTSLKQVIIRKGTLNIFCILTLCDIQLSTEALISITKKNNMEKYYILQKKTADRSMCNLIQTVFFTLFLHTSQTFLCTGHHCYRNVNDQLFPCSLFIYASSLATLSTVFFHPCYYIWQ